MQQHTRHFKQAAPLNQRLTEEAQRLRKEAKGTAAGFAREQLIRPAPQAETAARMQEWHASPQSASAALMRTRGASPG